MNDLPPSAAAYAARIDAVAAQGRRQFGPPAEDRWSGEQARRFRVDPHREPDRNLAALLEYVQPDDVVLDVGGGAGRVGLPVALRCREVVIVDPSEGMRVEFEDTVREAGIGNARFVRAGWMEADVQGDLAIVLNVTYFVREIVPFIRRLEAASRRRVLIGVWSVPPPSRPDRLREALFGEPVVPAPSYRELLPVLWDLGILPDVRVLPERFGIAGKLPATREEAVRWAINQTRAQPTPELLARADAVFDRLFAEGPEGYVPRWLPDDARELLITWETGAQGNQQRR